MSEDSFDYPRLLARATLGLVREVLEQVAEQGLPGEHHLYLTFRTGCEGVELPRGFRSRFPDTMTVVIQHQYERLAVDDEGFSVDLRFGGSWERLRIPFDSLTSFLDPSVPFGLDFTRVGGLEEAAADDRPAAPVADTDELPPPEARPESAAPDTGTSGDVLPFRRR